MRARRLVAVAGASALFVGTACELLVNHDVTEESADAATEAGAPANDSGVAPDTSYCHSVQPDLTPPTDDSGDAGTTNAVVLAVRTVTISGTPSGVDLDNTCTCQFGGKSTCVIPPNAPNGGLCDADGGVDDRASTLFSNFPGGFAQRFLDEANHFTACGQKAILLGISDYNGLRNDSSIKINSITSGGIYDPHAGGEDAGVDPGSCTPHDGGTPTLLPQWNGTDRWSTTPGDAVGNFPAGQLVNGIVKDYTLIADSRTVGQPPDLKIVFSLFGYTNVRFSHPVVVAKVRPTYADGGVIPLNDAGDPIAPAASFILEGTIVGRANADDVLRGAALSNYSSNMVLCTNPIFDINKPLICGYPDIGFDPANDSTGKTCDAISTSFQFVAIPALIGNDRPPDPPPANPCRPDQLSCSPVDAGADGG